MIPLDFMESSSLWRWGGVGAQELEGQPCINRDDGAVLLHLQYVMQDTGVA
jgi:hypothetical protein